MATDEPENYEWWDTVPPKFLEEYPLLAMLVKERRNPETEEELREFKLARSRPLYDLWG